MGQLIPIENIGSEGIVTDIPAWQLPPGTWSNGNNVRFDDVSVKKFPGYMEVMENCPDKPLHLETYQVYDGAEYYGLLSVLILLMAVSRKSMSTMVALGMMLRQQRG